MKKVLVAVYANTDFKIIPVLKKIEPLIDGIHVDIVDESFANNKAINSKMFEKIRELTKKHVSAHIMSKTPSNYLNSIKKYCDSIIVHYEINENLEKTLKKINSLNIKTGIALNPETPAKKIQKFFDLIDLIQVMGVNPGFSGQKILPETLKKAELLYNLSKKHCFKTIFDGGITIENSKKILCHTIASSSAILKASNPLTAIKNLKK
jgi:ribulose-phosphate 3-epimerase